MQKKSAAGAVMGLVLCLLLCVSACYDNISATTISTEVATADSITATVPVATEVPESSQTTEVTEPAEIIMTFAKKKSTMTAGKSYRFRVKVMQGTEKLAVQEEINWSVSNKKVAAVNQKGLVKAHRKGTVKITASYGGKKISCKVKIKGKKLIGIDPGHQSSGDSSLEPIGPGASVKKAKVSSGTSGVVTKIPEYQLNMTIAKALRKELLNRGYDVVMTRNKNNVHISNKERAVKLNEAGADIAIRLHADGGPASVRGASVLYPSASNPYVGKLAKKSKKLAEQLIEKYCDVTGIRNRGIVVRNDLTGTNWSEIPVVLLEMGFMSNSADDRYMASKKGQKKMVKGIADGIDAYYSY